MIKLDLSNNNLGGVIPLSLFTMPSLVYLLLNNNQFIGPLDIKNVSSSQLEVLQLSRNKLNGHIPRSLSNLSKLTSLFLGSNNFTGDCEFRIFLELGVLDVSNNGLNGTLPKCFGGSLSHLDIRGNNFHGSIPEICTDECNLRVLQLSQNQLQGDFSQSLTKCRELRIVDIGHNQIVGTFPFSLQALPKLSVLSLRSNKFHGPICNPSTFWGFVDLRVLDISSNDFNGKIPTEYFTNWSAMNAEPVQQLRYEEAMDGYYQYSVTLTSDYLRVSQVKFLSTLKAIDLSNNRFHGEIPDSIGYIQSLALLNLSSNGFTNQIPSSLGSLTKLEALDLSRNKLSGRIPDQLANLPFLAYLNLSENQLTGQIPQGAQFETFESSSYEGNLGLCGPPLSKECDKFGTPPTSISWEESFDWKSISMGYGCGIVIGLIAGHIIVSKRLDCFVETLADYIRSHIHTKNERGHTSCRLVTKGKRAH